MAAFVNTCVCMRVFVCKHMWVLCTAIKLNILYVIGDLQQKVAQLITIKCQ